MQNTTTKQCETVTESRDVTGINFAAFIGVDLHKTTVTLRAVDSSENIISSLTIDTKCVNKIEDWINDLPRPRWMAVEAVTFVEWFIDRYRDCVERIDIADAIELSRRRIIYTNRSDEFSARNVMLKSIPGIDEIWSCIIAAEVGPFDRFPNADALEFWAGLTPDNKESAGRTQSGKITKAGKAKTNVAMGRRLLRIIYAMMRDGALYECTEPTNHLKNANKARAKKRKQKKVA